MNSDEQNGPNTPPFGQHRGAGRPDDAPGAEHGTTGDPGHDFSSAFNTGPRSGPAFVTPESTMRQPVWDQQPWPHQPFQPQQPVPGGPSVGQIGAVTATKPRRRIGRLIGVVALSAVVGAGAGVGTLALATGDPTASVPISVSTSPASKTPVLNGTVEAAAKKIEPSVVTITVQSGRSGDIGSGVIIDKDGHILTNNHVVEAAAQNGKITVTFSDGTTGTATIVGTSPANDLAVIKVDGAKDLQPATFAESGSLSVGQAVVAAGAPLGLSESITSGIVSNQTRPVRSGSDNDAVYMAVQTDAAINPGNSGGPLVDLNGSVVGINSSIAGTGTGQGQSQAQSGNIGIGFAIPSDVATRVAAEIVATGKSPDTVMGVTVAGSDSADPTAAGVPLQSVDAGSPAAEAGLEAGDVVTQLNDFTVTSADGLIAATRYYAPGTEVTVTYTRGGDSHTTKVTLGSA